MLTDELWGGTLQDFALDIAAHDVTFVIDPDGDGKARHELRLSGATEVRFFSAIEPPWDYVEITNSISSGTAQRKNGAFDLMLWSEDAGISGRCKAVTVDGLDLREC